MNSVLGARGEAGLAEQARRVNRSLSSCAGRRLMSVDALDAVRPRGECAARRPDDPPDRPARRRRRRRTGDARRHRGAGGGRRAGAGCVRFRRAGGRTAGDRRPLRPVSGGDQEPARHDAQHAPPSAHHRLGAGRPRARALALGGLGGGQGLPQGQASAGHLAAWRWRRARRRAPASRPRSPRAISSSRRRNSPPGARPAFFPTRACASGSSARDWIWRGFSRSG